MSARGHSGPERTPVPLYIITRGRSRPADRSALDPATLVTARCAPRSGMAPEHAAVLRLCGRPLAVAEVSARLDLPFGAAGVLLSDLRAEGHVELREPGAARARSGDADAEIALLRALIDGLQRL
ncbi:DUF742 domain-containing protein [Streptomyces sodiiphilus]|uniref:DUF742 domain-containing protein n=1 Tax=Streptomyces sodiiphilus TaxID=226217 RepID=A0ABN2NS75_9ACTN